MEALEKEAKNLYSNVNGGSLATQVHKLHRHTRQHSTTNPQVKRDDGTRSDKMAKTAKPCYHSGGEHSSDKCRFKGAKCRYCHKTGHIASACRCRTKDNKSRPINAATGCVSELTPSEYGLPIDHVQNLTSEPMTVTVRISGAPIKIEVDTGATLSI